MFWLLERMRTPVREAFSYGIRHVIRHVYCDSMSYDQIRVKPYRVYLGVAKYGLWYSAECMHWNAKKKKKKKISCKSLQKSDWSYGNERKTSPTNHTQFTWLKLWIKEENGVHKVTINLTSHHTGLVTIHFVREAVVNEIEDAYCRTGEDTAYDTWLWGMSEWFVPRHAVWITHLHGMMPVVQSWIK